MTTKLLLLNILLMFSISCNSDISYVINEKNPTEYGFPAGIDSIRYIIKNEFEHEQFYGLSLASKDYILTYNIFKDPKNSNDFVLEEFSSWHMCKSKVYYNKDNEPLIYSALYHIHLEKINENSTKVIIYTHRSGIIYKTKYPVLPHFNRVNRLKELPPTTVEEYEILQIIGKAMGINDMPSLIIPEKIIIKNY